ncbi:MAG TPA: hypothetical protein VGJ92_11920 [Methanocella sp.]|jgi:hypothetical protein
MKITPELVFLALRSELGHFLFGACVSLAVAWLAYSSISIIYRATFSASADCPCPGTSRTWARAGFYILLVSLSAAVCSHVLEDVFFSWF